MNVIAILACHDRRELTRRCLESARDSARQAGTGLRFVVFDDGSSDGTAELLASSADVVTVNGDGHAFWAKGMAEAERVALADAADSDALIWLNDDVELEPDAVGRLTKAVAARPDAIWVAALVDPATRELSYSGLRRSGPHPLRFERVPPRSDPQPVDTFNGNVVGLSVGLARRMGGIDGGFSHSFADIDYGLRAQSRGIPVLLAAGVFGTCSRNPQQPRQSAVEEWRAFTDRKGGGSYADLRRLIRRRHPVTWPAPIAVSYLLWWTRRLSIRRHVPEAGGPGR